VPDAIARKRMAELLELVELTDAADRLVGTYSGGMRKRLELAVGLIHEPKVLFLDEPTLGLDVQTRARIWDYIRMLNRERKITIFMTTHYLEEADLLCDRVAIIDHGKIMTIGAPAELKAKLGGDTLELDITDGSGMVEFLTSLPGAKDVKNNGTRFTVRVPRIEDALPAIFEGVARRGGHVSRVSFARPSLDQVFLQVTGKSMRDEDASGEDRRFTAFTRVRRR